jgi:hypothetical protein
MSTATTFKPGDVLTYLTERDHCRETTAFVLDNGRAVDTFWRGDFERGSGEVHSLTAAELETAEVRFNVNDYDQLDLYAASSRALWETYHPDDRGRIPSQHGLQETLFVRRGATPHLETQIENAKADVAKAEAALSVAECRLEWARSYLADLEGLRLSPAASAPTRPSDPAGGETARFTTEEPR